MFSSVRRNAVGATVFVGATVAGFRVNPAVSDRQSTSDSVQEILCGVNSIKKDLGIGCAAKQPQVDPVGNFPFITPNHRSLACKYIKANPEQYAKYCNEKTPMGFTFDQAIQCGLDAPHLGVGIAAGEAASYTVYKDVMDAIIEGWHGYKPTDTHT